MAEELRTIADDMERNTKEAILRIAEDYELMARAAERISDSRHD